MIYHVALQDRVIKVSSDVMDGNSSLNVTTLPRLVMIGIVVVEMFFICHVASLVHMFESYVILWVEASYGKSPPSNFGGHRACYSRDITYLSHVN